MRIAYVAGLGVIAILALVPIACNDSDDNVTPTSVGGDMATSTTTQVRFAHLSPNKPPIDICLAVHGSGQFTGPLLKPTGVASIGLAYTQVSKYLPVTAGSWDVRIVDGGATSCAQSLFDATNLPAFSGGSSVTVVSTGLIPPQPGNPNAFTMAAYADDQGAPSGNAMVRFVHSAPATPALDFGSGSGSGFSALFDNVAYLAFGSSPSSPDGNGYIGIAAAGAPGTFSVRVHGSGSDTVTIASTAAQTAGSAVTFYAIGSLTPMPKPLQVLVCVDNGAPVGPLSPCTPLP